MASRTVIVNWPAIRAQLDQALATGNFGNLDLEHLLRQLAEATENAGRGAYDAMLHVNFDDPTQRRDFVDIGEGIAIVYDCYLVGGMIVIDAATLHRWMLQHPGSDR